MKIVLFILFFSNIAFSQVSFNELQTLKMAMHSAFIELRPSDNDVLSINSKVGDIDNYWWDLEATHASYAQVEIDGKVQHHVYLFGGFARLDKMTLDGLALTACHEIGHGIGGFPKKVTGNTSEGQADYYSTKVCLPILLKYLSDTTNRSQDNYIHQKCEKQTTHSFDLCVRLFTAIESDIAFFEFAGETTSMDNFSSNIALELDSSPRYYPDSQCRIDTMIHGVLGLERPRCWYPGGVEREL